MAIYKYLLRIQSDTAISIDDNSLAAHSDCGLSLQGRRLVLLLRHILQLYDPEARTSTKLGRHSLLQSQQRVDICGTCNLDFPHARIHPPLGGGLCGIPGGRMLRRGMKKKGFHGESVMKDPDLLSLKDLGFTIYLRRRIDSVREHIEMTREKYHSLNMFKATRE